MAGDDGTFAGGKGGSGLARGCEHEARCWTVAELDARFELEDRQLCLFDELKEGVAWQHDKNSNQPA